MIRPTRKVYCFYVVVDLMLMAISFYATYLLRYNSVDDILKKALYLPYLREYTFILILWAFFLLLLLKNKELYCTDRSLSVPREIGRVCSCVFYTSILVGAFVFFSQYNDQYS